MISIRFSKINFLLSLVVVRFWKAIQTIYTIAHWCVCVIVRAQKLNNILKTLFLSTMRIYVLEWFEKKSLVNTNVHALSANVTAKLFTLTLYIYNRQPIYLTFSQRYNKKVIRGDEKKFIVKEKIQTTCIFRENWMLYKEGQIADFRQISRFHVMRIRILNYFDDFI